MESVTRERLLLINLLAIDTALSACSVALLAHGRVSMLREATPRQHIKCVLPMIDNLLKANALQLGQLDALAFISGPGSFTGLRIGLGVVQGLALGADLPVLPVSTLQALAQEAIEHQHVGEQELIMPVIDARMDEVYWGIYRNEGGLAQALQDDRLSVPEEIASAYHALFIRDSRALPVPVDNPVLGIGLGDGWLLGERISLQPRRVDVRAATDAEMALRLALVAYGRGEARSIDEVELTYLRNKTTWKKRQKLRL